ncbi:MAG TPA: hypothetical protein VLV16_03395 [Gemmatimonadales bacterium]|nr:hypothetical protein [Gemmatimonadales bacterium]
MAKHSKERRGKSDRRGGADRRVRQVPVEVDRRQGGERRTGLDRRVELATAGDQLHAAISLLNFAVEKGVMLDVDRWVLETAITRLKIALAKLDEDPPSDD